MLFIHHHLSLLYFYLVLFETNCWCCSKYQHFLDISTVWTKTRWIFSFVTTILYFLHIFYGLNETEIRNGSYAIVTYALGIYLLNLFIGFLTPQVRESLIVSRFV